VSSTSAFTSFNSFALLQANLLHTRSEYDCGPYRYQWTPKSKPDEKHYMYDTKTWHQQLKYAKLYNSKGLAFDGVPVRVVYKDGSISD